MAAIGAISFDLFDTLVDLKIDYHMGGHPTANVLHDAVSEHADLTFDEFVEQLRSIDRQFRNERAAAGIEVPTLERFGRLVETLEIAAPGLPERLTHIHMGVIESHVEVPGHHCAILRSLHERTRVGVCSNFTHAATARRILDQGGLSSELDTIVISEEVGLRKPRAEVFEAMLSGLGAQAGETLHVGDNLRADVAGAAALGIRTAWVTRRVPDPEKALADYEGPRPDWIIHDLAELQSLLDSGSPAG